MRTQHLIALLFIFGVSAAPVLDTEEVDNVPQLLQERAIPLRALSSLGKLATKEKPLKALPKLSVPKVAPKPKLPAIKPPKVSAPKIPKVTAPKVPKVTAPKVPKVTAPKVPKVTAPKVPKVTAPKVPKVTTPKVPKVTAPKVPKVTAPKVPKVTAPKVPKVTAPKTPKVTAPKTPKVTAPKTPKVTTPKTPKITTPKTPKASTKAPAGKTAGKTPATKCKRGDESCALNAGGAPPPPPPPPPPPGGAKVKPPPRPVTPPPEKVFKPGSVVKVGGKDVNIGAAIDDGKVHRGTFNGQNAVIKNSLENGEIEKTEKASKALGNGFFLHSGNGPDGKPILVTKQLQTKNLNELRASGKLSKDPKQCQEQLAKARETAAQAQLKLAKGAGFVQGDTNFNNFHFNDDLSHADVIDFGQTIPAQANTPAQEQQLLKSQRAQFEETVNPKDFGC